MFDYNALDYAKIVICSGKGGPGSKHFRRERFVPKGGPDGGDGGRGGHVIVVGKEHLSHLLHFKYRKHVFAEDGKPGAGKQTTGADGKDVVLEVPLGTVIKDADTGKMKAEIMQAGQTAIIAKGGRGGKGNVHFKSAIRQAPDFAQIGEEGKKLSVILELKMIAEVGLLGLPNAGKSTLLSVISAAKPKIANYPFTTLTPQLGTVQYAHEGSFCVADIPGIIEGASQGKGLGLRFLKHAERTKILLFVIAAEHLSAVDTYYMLRRELKAYDPELLAKKHIIALSKTDLCKEDILAQVTSDLPKNITCIHISSKTGAGITKLKESLQKLLQECKNN